jgi:hypothetical protein
MQKLLAALLFIFIHRYSNCQEILTLRSVPKIPGSKCYWSYSIERIGILKDSTHRYGINFSLCQRDSSGKYNNWHVKIRGAKIKCEYIDNGKRSKIYFIAQKDRWIADFIIHTNKPLDITIIAKYNKQKRTMKVILNTGIYPGELNS